MAGVGHLAAFAFLALYAAVSTSERSFSCYCTQDQYNGKACSNESCEVSDNGFCFRASFAVEPHSDLRTSAGCGNSSTVNRAKYSLTIVSIRSGLSYVAFWQCSKNYCNDKSWSSIGALSSDADCFGFNASQPQQDDILSILWNDEGVVMNNISGWCPNCNKSIRFPTSNETLCQWAKEMQNNETLVKPEESPGEAKYVLYISGAVLGAMFLFGVVVSIVEFLKAMRDKRAHPPAPKKKKAHREIKLASPLTPFTVLAGPTVVGKAADGKIADGKPTVGKIADGKTADAKAADTKSPAATVAKEAAASAKSKEPKGDEKAKESLSVKSKVSAKK